ncbi:hypothetical protein [Novosphingobium sp. FSW06-99]|uniref:hypothetical protein n=1 Tax=Novosphingobium sp. FSW06-99 TaxID=1739113 RepID=UPI000B1900E3|nr:hypothetical protein [Novosphingobium sp. FSW06-99]
MSNAKSALPAALRAGLLGRIAAGLALATVAMGPIAAHAETQWQKNHPARTHVNKRLANQNRRISAGVRDGQLTHAQAHALRADDHAIRQQERADARADHNHGHLTGAQARSLNQEENANSAAIHADRH